jgi:hypothetical protein
MTAHRLAVFTALTINNYFSSKEIEVLSNCSTLLDFIKPIIIIKQQVNLLTDFGLYELYCY